jgi:hypothetical protein
MNTQTRVTAPPAFQLVLYRRALHPELFALKARKALKIPGGEFEAWLANGTHVLRLQSRQACVCELLTDREGGLPTTGVTMAFPCVGDRDAEQEFEDARLTYVVSVQTETLGESLYTTTYQEINALARETDGLVTRWETEAGKCLSLLDIQRYPNEVHVQGYHLMAAGGLVLRSQTIFEYRG